MQTISPIDAHAIDDAFILDVREPGELAQARIDGTLHIPLGALVERLDEVPRDRTVYVMCHAGERSARAAEYLGSPRLRACGAVTWRSTRAGSLTESDS